MNVASPLAPAGLPDLPAIDGVRWASAAANVRYPGRTDVTLIALARGTTLAGVFTRSATRAASVLDAQAKLAAGAGEAEGAAIVVNSGNANAFTGRAGDAAVQAVTGAVGRALGVPAGRVLSASTGVIGEALPHKRICAAVDGLVAALGADGIVASARAIMTTDTFPKVAAATLQVDGQTVHIAGIAKGSGMIAPDMATMLGFIFTDAAVPSVVLQSMLAAQVGSTFNAITVDGDTSTSDMVLLAATGRGAAIGPEDAGRFAAALHGVMRDLAQQIVRDGEGATKFIEVAVSGARDDADARRVAMSIANSPLVKTAAAGEDPNWGRIVMAVGKSGAAADRDRLAVHMGDIVVAQDGQVAPGYTEADGAAYMKRSDLRFGVDLGLGDGAFTAWTCDLTHRYIEINADYRS